MTFLRWVAAVVFLVGGLALQAQAPQLTLQGEVRRAQFMTYQEVPFTVPADVVRLTVEFAYTGHDAGTNLDLGVLDPQRFRGWSGGNKHGFTISESDATPSYLPGEIPAGAWRLLVGVPAIRKGSVAKYTVHVWWQLRGQADPNPSTFSSTPIRTGAAWYRGDLHMHTAHSDGSCRSQMGQRVPCPLFLTVEAAEKRGLDFIAITDHNTISHFDAMRELQPYFDNLLLLPGREITTFYGHANVFGTTEFLDFRLGTKAVPTMDALLDEVEKAHGVLSLNHPAVPSGEQCMGCGWTAPGTDFRRIRVMEAVNGTDADGPLSGVGMWQRELNRGLRITAVGGSDNHDATKPEGESNAVGSPTTVVYAASLTDRDILAGVLAGHVFVDTEGTRDRWLEMTAVQGAQRAAMGDAMTVRAGTRVNVTVTVRGAAGMHALLLTDGVPTEIAGGLVHAGSDERTVMWQSDGAHHTLRVEVRDARGALKLLGNPVYIN